MMDFPATPPQPAPLPSDAAGVLGITGAVTCVGTTAMNLTLRVPTAEHVRACRPNLAVLATWHPVGVVVTALDDEPGVDFVSRFFAPQAGVPEDPVTGSAHCALAPYWMEQTGRQALRHRGSPGRHQERAGDGMGPGGPHRPRAGQERRAARPGMHRLPGGQSEAQRPSLGVAGGRSRRGRKPRRPAGTCFHHGPSANTEAFEIKCRKPEDRVNVALADGNATFRSPAQEASAVRRLNGPAKSGPGQSFCDFTFVGWSRWPSPAAR